MTRRQRRQLLYVAIMVGVLTIVLVSVDLAAIGPVELLGVAALFLIPGRLAAWMLRDLMASRRHLAAERLEDAAAAADRAVAKLEAAPWRRWFLFGMFSFYTWDALAMALNNRGAARMLLGRLDEAAVDLRDALARDPGYAIPIYNLAAISAATGDSAEAERLFAEAAVFGYSGGATDQLIAAVAASYAQLPPR